MAGVIVHPANDQEVVEVREAYVKLAETPAAAWYRREDAVREARVLEEVCRELDPTHLLFCDPEWLASRIPPLGTPVACEFCGEGIAKHPYAIAEGTAYCRRCLQERFGVARGEALPEKLFYGTI